MVGVVEGDCCDVDDAVVEGVGCGEEGRKDIESVPEKRTTDTASAMGRIAVKGFG